jgi:signal transduction histidine kinase
MLTTPLGVRSMRERTEMLGEDLRVDSGSGTGTRAELRVSLDGRFQQPREGSP